jgi:branched-subunit amino acid aminotransferase/4-amino-4-deoxychorismate lyase
VQAVGSIDHLAIRDGQPGPVTRRLRQRLEESAEGADSNHPEWLFLV